MESSDRFVDGVKETGPNRRPVVGFSFGGRLLCLHINGVQLQDSSARAALGILEGTEETVATSKCGAL